MPEAQAPAKVRHGPERPSLIERAAADALGMVIATEKGLKARGIASSASTVSAPSNP